VRTPAQLRNQRRFGDNIRNRRNQVGWSQEDLAHAAGMHVTAISRLERGVREPGLHTIVDVSRALSVKPEALLHGLK
jgi:transcriptional regulator with XRE-family HTH domain